MATLGRIGAEIKVLATAKLTISTATTSNFDFGTPDDVNIPSTNYKSGDRLVVLFRATSAAATSNISFSVQDAADNGSGAINTGSLATAITDTPAAASGGDKSSFIGIELQPNRPWLRFRATNSGTEAYTCSALLLAIPNGV